MAVRLVRGKVPVELRVATVITDFDYFATIMRCQCVSMPPLLMPCQS